MANGYDVNAVASALKSILETRNNPAANLAQVAYNASLRANPPIYVVPDKPQYGAEPVKGPQQYLGEMLSSIEAYRAKNPVYIPFAPGTPTMGRRQFDAQEQARAFQEEVTQAGLTGTFRGQPTLEARQLALSAQRLAQQGSQQPQQFDPMGALKQQAYQRYMQGQATEDDLVILGLRNRPSLPREDTQQEDSTEQLLSLLGQMGDDTEPEALKEAKNSVDYALGMGLSVQEIEQSINSQRADLLAEGVDPDEVIRYLYRQRPWWQKAIDILPGRQYR